MKLKKLFFLGFLISFSVQQGCKSPTSEINYGNNQKAGKYIFLRGIKIYYESYGKGEPLIMIHGNGGSIRDFEKQIPYFNNTYQVIVADSRAQGKSIDSHDSLSYEMMADDVNVLLDTLHVKPCDIIGWSDGGIIGLLLAIHHPDKVRKLVVSGANLWPDSTAISPSIWAYTKKLYYRNLFLLKRGVDSDVEVKNRLKLLNILVFQPHITIAQLHKISCPTLVISGDHDIIRPEHTLLIAHSIRNSNLWIVPNAGHDILIGHEEQFNEIIFDFLNQP